VTEIDLFVTWPRISGHVCSDLSPSAALFQANKTALSWAKEKKRKEVIAYLGRLSKPQNHISFWFHYRIAELQDQEIKSQKAFESFKVHFHL
jgi:hypothetical protein